MALSFEQRPAESDAVRIIHAAIERGATLLDTADIYAPDERDIGHNERLIAGALRSWPGPRRDVIVATKGGYTRQSGRLVPNGHPVHLRNACERSLRALGVDEIDLYQLHTPDPSIPLEDSVGALRELRNEGKIRWLGLSNVNVTTIEAARAIVPIQSVQNELSLFRRDCIHVGPIGRLERSGLRGIRQLRRLVGEPFQSGVLAHCEHLGIGFLAYSPLGGPRNQRLSSHAVVTRIAKSHGVSTHALAIAWVLAQGRSVIPIPSARTLSHAMDALTAASVELEDAELAELEGATI
jgi:aryl-alcohol dehydrogenase-like predicted oxidoreductase